MHPQCGVAMNKKGDVGSSKTASSNLRDVLLAATALTALNDCKESSNDRGGGVDSRSGSDTVTMPTPATWFSAPSNRDLPPRRSANDEDHDGDGEGDYGLARTFPQKLMDMLSHEHVSHAISWHSDGKSFVITNPQKLTEDVLPCHFKQAKYDSFVRKLYRWGFRQADKQDLGQIAFYHQHFQRGKLQLALSKVRPIKSSIQRGKLQLALSKVRPIKSSMKDAGGKTARMMPSTAPQLHKNMKNFGTPSLLNALKSPHSKLLNHEMFQLGIVPKPGSSSTLAKSLSMLAAPSSQKTALSRQLVKMSSASITHQLRMDAFKRDLGLKNVEQLTRAPKLLAGSTSDLQKSFLPQMRASSQPNGQPLNCDEIVRAAIDALRHAS